MSFQTQTSPMRSIFQGHPVHISPTHARRLRRTQVQLRALGALESLPIVVEAMKIGFAYAAIPGVIKGAWDVKQAMAEPHLQKPLTDAGKGLIVSKQATRWGASGALMGLSAGVWATQLGLAPDTAWQAGTVTGLCLYAVLVGVGKQLRPAGKSVLETIDRAKDDAPTEPNRQKITDPRDDEDACEMPEDWQI